MKTIKYFLCSLPQPALTWALANLHPDADLNKRAENMELAIAQSFNYDDLDKTPEGFKYWYNVAKEYDEQCKKMAYSEALFINEGSVWDIQIHLKNNSKRYSIRELTEEIGREKITRNRSTVVKLIQARLNKMEKCIGDYKPAKSK